MVWWWYIENMISGGLSHNFVLNSSWVIFKKEFFILQIEILIKLVASLMLVFSIFFKSFKNCCGKRRRTPLGFLLQLAGLYFFWQRWKFSSNINVFIISFKFIPYPVIKIIWKIYTFVHICVIYIYIYIYIYICIYIYIYIYFIIYCFYIHYYTNFLRFYHYFLHVSVRWLKSYKDA